MNSHRLLTIKIGNTNLGIGIFDDANLLHSWRAETRPEQTADEYAALLFRLFKQNNVSPDSIHASAIVSVVPVLTETLREMCSRYLHLEPFIAAAGVRSGIRIKYDDPRSLGADRLVSLVAAKQTYGTPLILIDLGTATTFNALDEAGDFVGGAIAPGLNMAAGALHQFTAKLPWIEIVPPERSLATNTRDALRSGIFFGYVGLVEGMVVRMRREMGAPNATIIATGGMSHLLAPHCALIQHVDADLALQGLRLVYEMNHKPEVHA
jgi:type III pantothenate kinase